jgi:hypothetical protein
MLYTCITTWSHINLRSYARRSMFEKGRKFSPPFLWSEEWFCRPLNNCSYEVNYLDVGDQPIFTRVFFPQNISRTRVTIHTYCSSKIYMLEATPTCYLKQQRKVLLSSSFHYWIKCDHKKTWHWHWQWEAEMSEDSKIKVDKRFCWHWFQSAT